MTESIDPSMDDYPMCRRGLHPLAPENVRRGNNGGRVCRACKCEYNRRRRAGLPWDGPGRFRGSGSAGGAVKAPLDPERLLALRVAVGACPECGWARDEDAEPHRCTAVGTEPPGVAC